MLNMYFNFVKGKTSDLNKNIYDFVMQIKDKPQLNSILYFENKHNSEIWVLIEDRNEDIYNSYLKAYFDFCDMKDLNNFECLIIEKNKLLVEYMPEPKVILELNDGGSSI